MIRTDELKETLKKEIIAGKYGISGSRFVAVRDFSKKYQCSSRDAISVFCYLKDEGLIRIIGKHYYVCTGFCKKGSPYHSQLLQRQKPIYGVIVKNISNPFFSSIVKNLQTVIHKKNAQLIVSDGEGIQKNERNILNMFVDLGCRGIFNCLSLSLTQQRFFSRCPIPIVTMAEDVSLPNADAVVVDNYISGNQAAAHLIARGCRSFSYLGIDDCADNDQRFDGYYNYLQENGFILLPEHIGIIPNSGGSIDSAHVKTFITTLLYRALNDKSIYPLGIFCHHDMLAVEASRCVKSFAAEHKILDPIPRDVKIVGFDNLSITAAVSPTITTMAYRYSEIAKKAFELMEDYQKNAGHVPATYKIPSSLIIRDSTREN